MLLLLFRWWIIQSREYQSKNYQVKRNELRKKKGSEAQNVVFKQFHLNSKVKNMYYWEFATLYLSSLRNNN